MDFTLRSSPPNKILLVALALALGLHGLLLLIKFNIGSFEATDLKKPLLVTLMTDDSPIFQEPQIDEVIRELIAVTEEPTEAESLVEASPPVATASVITIDRNEDDSNPTQTASISQLDVTRWIQNDAIEFVDERQKVQLSGLRKGTYEHALLDPSRPDQRTSPTSDRVATSDGLIHVQKIKGQTVCMLKADAGPALNGLDLVPISGKSIAYACGDTKKQNVLLAQDGTIKNSDVQEWSISD